MLFLLCMTSPFVLYIHLCRYDSHQQQVKIALVGKYTKLEDAYISVIKALKHAALSCRYRLTLIVSETCLSFSLLRLHTLSFAQVTHPLSLPSLPPFLLPSPPSPPHLPLSSFSSFSPSLPFPSLPSPRK